MFDTALAGCFVVDRKAWEKIGVERLNTKLRPKAIPNNINCFLIQSKYKYYDIYYGKWYYVVFLTHNLQIHDLVIKFSKAPFRVNVKKKLEDFIFNTANIYRNQGNSSPSEQKYWTLLHVLLQELRNVTKGNFIFGCSLTHYNCRKILTNMTLIFENNNNCIYLNFSF